MTKSKTGPQVKPLICWLDGACLTINYRRLREIIDQVDAVLMVDIAHFAGLVAGRVFTGELNQFFTPIL